MSALAPSNNACAPHLQAFAAACVHTLRAWHARRTLHWWRGLVEARALVGRVLQRAQDAWDADADTALVFGGQFHELQQVGAARTLAPWCACLR